MSFKHAPEQCICDVLQSAKRSILERLQEGPVIGDGGFVFILEKRGYLKAGPWTPEVTVEHPEAGNFCTFIFLHE